MRKKEFKVFASVGPQEQFWVRPPKERTRECLSKCCFPLSCPSRDHFSILLHFEGCHSAKSKGTGSDGGNVQKRETLFNWLPNCLEFCHLDKLAKIGQNNLRTLRTCVCTG